MAIAAPDDHINKLIEAFGIDMKDLVSFTLKIRIDEIVSIELEKYPSKEDLKNGAKEAEIILKTYALELVEKKEE